VTVLDQPFVAHGNVATAGGCLAAAHLSTWLLSRLVDPHAAADTLATIAPVGQQASFVAQVMATVERTTHQPSAAARPVSAGSTGSA
jgi:transcriptional regulator GlxA family with amidase domain